jgi:sugar fermentation stimulation protein A
MVRLAKTNLPLRDLERALFRNRLNRFTVECFLKGELIKAYLPNPGRLWELLLPGRALYLQKNLSENKLSYTVIAVEKEGLPILLHTHLANILVERLIKKKMLPGFEDTEIIRREATYGKDRYDFLLGRRGKQIVLEVKTCTLFNNTLAMFPDAVTLRGSRHLQGLADLAEKGMGSAVIFVVQWPFAKYFMPEHHTDLEFAKNLLRVKERILVKAISLRFERDLLSPSEARELIIPWEIVEREASDGGSYIIIFSLPEDRSINIGGLGRMTFNRSWYLYVGSARQNLQKRIHRHQRKRKQFHWHIDYLAAEASFHKALPIRTNEDLECEIAKRLKEIADRSIPGFGSSDCACESHLFEMRDDPIKSPRFIEMLMDFRIGRIERELEGIS